MVPQGLCVPQRPKQHNQQDKSGLTLYFFFVPVQQSTDTYCTPGTELGLNPELPCLLCPRNGSTEVDTVISI